MTLMVPAEWSPHRAMWVGFPSHSELWEDNLAPAQAEVADLVRALAGPGEERVRLLVSGETAAKTARTLLDDVRGVEIVNGRFGDIWLRDTGPIFAKTGDGLSAVGFRFNGWGGKYVLEGDDTVAAQIAEASGVPRASPRTRCRRRWRWSPRSARRSSAAWRNSRSPAPATKASTGPRPDTAPAGWRRWPTAAPG